MKIWQNGEQMCSVMVADTFLSRLKGLMFQKQMEASAGLLIQRCSSIHTFFMRFPIDVIYLDKEYRILYTETVLPWRIGKIVRHTRHILELPWGSREYYVLGCQLQLTDN